MNIHIKYMCENIFLILLGTHTHTYTHTWKLGHMIYLCLTFRETIELYFIVAETLHNDTKNV